jgi:hypothetical protein
MSVKHELTTFVPGASNTGESSLARAMACSGGSR